MKKILHSSLGSALLAFLLLGCVRLINWGQYPFLTIVTRLCLIILGIYFGGISVKKDMEKLGIKKDKPIPLKRKLLYALLIIAFIIAGVIMQLVLAPLF